MMQIEVSIINFIGEKVQRWKVFTGIYLSICLFIYFYWSLKFSAFFLWNSRVLRHVNISTFRSDKNRDPVCCVYYMICFS